MERIGSVMIFDVSQPTRPSNETYINARSATTGDLGPEGTNFAAADKSPNGKPLLVVGHEISSTTAVYQINLKY
jgi:hypothetical protein